MNPNENTLNYNQPIKVADGIYWIGFFDAAFQLHCNPYLIIEGDEAILIDGGSRTDFSTVMLKILQTGLHPSQIKHLFYSHYDPDLCGSIPEFEEIIDRNDLSILTHTYNVPFIKYYGGKSPIISLDQIDYTFTFETGRKLQFIHTPYAHSEGSTMIYDEQTHTLFTGDMFGSYSPNWELYINIPPTCLACSDNSTVCYKTDTICDLQGLLDFHKKIIPSTQILRYTLNSIKNLDLQLIAPQHGSVIKGASLIKEVIDRLLTLEEVGIDAFRRS